MTLSLPDEVTGLVFSYLDALSLVRCMQVCKLFHSIISGSTQLVYKIELFASLMEDGEHSPLDTVDRLDALREHNRAWNDMKWTSTGSIPMRDGHCWEYSGGILAQATAQNEIFFVQLPCKPKGIPEQRWTVPFDFGIRDFTLDNSQDLVVLLQLSDIDSLSYSLHLRTLSGEPHPRAVSSQITHTLEDLHLEFSFLIQICGHHVAVLFNDQLDQNVPSFLVWNWQTGQREVLIHMAEFHSFAFMTEDLILAAIVRSDKEPCLQVLSIAALGDPALSLDDIPHICELRLPVLNGSSADILIRSEPTPTWKAPANIRAPFYTSKRDFIFTISLRIMTDGDIYENNVFFVPLSTLLTQIERSRDVPRRSVTWSEWGPDGSRMIARDPSETWVCYTYGMKFIQGLPWKNGQEARVYDFNPYAAKGCVKTSADSPIPWKRLASRTKSDVRYQGFDEEVTTSLPGRVATLKLDASDDGWEAAMIGEDNILMVQSEASKYGYMAM